MALPRFTKGQTGNLEFSALNEAFEAIDNLRRGGERPPERFKPRAAGAAGPILVKVATTTSDPVLQRWGWVEMELLNVPSSVSATYLTYAVKTGGATSNGLEVPIVGNLNPGEICLANRQVGNGLPYYIPTREVFEPFAAKIISVATASTLGQFTYTVQEQYFNPTTNAFVNGGLIFDCVNLAELVADTTSLYGVGFNKPSGVSSLVRSRVRVGVVVQIFRVFDADHLSFKRCFTMPNPYTVVC